MSGRPPGGLVRGYGVGLALLRLDVGAIARFDGSLDEARESMLALFLSVPLYYLSVLLAGGLDLATLTRFPVLVAELSSFAVASFATPVLVSLLAPSVGRSERVPLFITVYNYLGAVAYLLFLAVVLLSLLSDETALLAALFFNLFRFWAFIVMACAFRAVLALGWQHAIALAAADFLISWMASDWADALVGTLPQS